MGFAVSTHDIPTLGDYGAAFAKWTSIKPIRGRATDIRPLSKNRNDHMVIRKDPDGSIACRLYRTDMVTYHPGGTITIEGHNSQSSNAFTRALLPAGIDINYTHRLGYLVGVRRREVTLDRGYNDRLYPSWTAQQAANDVYLFKRTALLYRDEIGWNVDTKESDLDTFDWPTLNRARARDALADCRVPDFLAWVDARFKLDPQGFRTMASAEHRRVHDEQIYAALKDPEQWPGLVAYWCERKWRPLLHTSDYADHARKFAYQWHKCVDVEQFTHVTGDKVTALTAAYRKYLWAC